jgi:hypothetical protein
LQNTRESVSKNHYHGIHPALSIVSEMSSMNQFDRAVMKAEEDDGPQLRVMGPPKGAMKDERFTVALRVVSPAKSRLTRPELAALAWDDRAQRLAARK